MNDDGCEIFEGFGACGENTAQPNQDTTSVWADRLVDAVFNDSDCERLQVTSIIFAIQEMGFPEAEQVLKLEQQLDPKNEGLTVDKPTLRQAAQQWIKLCKEGKEVDNSFEAEGNGTSIVDLDTKSSSFHDVQLKKEDHYKNEISGLYTMLNASEENIKSLQLERDVLKKSVKNLQTTLKKAEGHQVHAEESKATLNEFLLVEKSKRIAQVSALENQLTLAKDQLDIVTKDNEELSANKIDDNRTIKDLRGELVVKCNELDELVQENGILKARLEQRSERLRYAEIEICQLKNTNFELMEHGIEWKKTILDLKEENDLLRKKILARSSRFKKGETVSTSNSDLGSDSSNIGEVSIFSPDYFSSPLASEKLSTELAESGIQELVTMETTHRIPRPPDHATEVASSLVHAHKRMRKRKLFDIPPLEPKRCRSGDVEATSMVRLYQKETLPIERATSFAINLTIRQKLLEALRQTLWIHPHLFGCIRDFVARQVSCDIKGTEFLSNDLTSLFYEFCTAQQRQPFCGRQFLRVICEEQPTLSNSTAVQSSHLNEVSIEPFNNDDALQDNPHSTYTVEFKSLVHSETLQAMPPANTNVIGSHSDSVIYAHEFLHSEGAANVLLQNNLKSSFTELQTSVSSSDPVNEPSLSAAKKTVANVNSSDAAGINSNIAINCMVLSQFMENNPHASELELIPSKSSPDLENLMLPTDGKMSKEFVLGASSSLICENLTNSPDHNDEGTEKEKTDFEDFDVSGTLPENDYSLLNNISEVMNESSPLASAVMTGTVPACNAVTDEMCVQAIGSGSSDESDQEYHSCQYLLIEPSFDLYSDCNSELFDGSSPSDLETLDSPLCFGVESQDVARNEASRTGCLDEHVTQLRPSKKLSLLPLPNRCFKLMAKIFLFFLLLILLFFSYLALSKVVLTEEEYKNLLYSLGGKYSRNGIPPY